MNIHYRILFALGLLLTLEYSCKKSDQTPLTDVPVPPGGAGTSSLSYGDSVLYLRAQSGDYLVSPVHSPGAGKYFGFPEGIQIDGNSGVINVSKSETGLRYLISFVPDHSNDTVTTMVTNAGINFLDGFYKLAEGDSIAFPIYNGWRANPIPGLNDGTVFDEGSNCNRQGCTIDMGLGQINLAQTVRNGVFGAVPSNNDRQEFLMSYRINDNSQEALNSIDIKIYYFDTMADVSQEVYDIISSRQGTILGSTFAPATLLQNRTGNTLAITGLQNAIKPAKPRPPCIFIIGR